LFFYTVGEFAKSYLADPIPKASFVFNRQEYSGFFHDHGLDDYSKYQIHETRILETRVHNQDSRNQGSQPRVLETKFEFWDELSVLTVRNAPGIDSKSTLRLIVIT